MLHTHLSDGDDGDVLAPLQLSSKLNAAESAQRELASSRDALQAELTSQKMEREAAAREVAKREELAREKAQREKADASGTHAAELAAVREELTAATSARDEEAKRAVELQEEVRSLQQVLPQTRSFARLRLPPAASTSTRTGSR